MKTIKNCLVAAALSLSLAGCSGKLRHLPEIGDIESIAIPSQELLVRDYANCSDVGSIKITMKAEGYEIICTENNYFKRDSFHTELRWDRNIFNDDNLDGILDVVWTWTYQHNGSGYWLRKDLSEENNGLTTLDEINITNTYNELIDRLQVGTVHIAWYRRWR